MESKEKQTYRQYKHTTHTNMLTADEKINSSKALAECKADEYYEPFDYEYQYHCYTPGWQATMDTISKYPDELYSLLVASENRRYGHNGFDIETCIYKITKKLKHHTV